MNKATKGALAAVAGGTLLLGGAGTLAYWTDSSTNPGGTITGGTLSLGDPDCVWTLAHAGTTTANITDISTVRLVPGDTATQTCTSEIDAVGNNIAADLSVTTPFAASGDLAAELDVDAVFTIDGATVARITSANDADELEAVVTVAFPFAAATNSTNGAKAATIPDFVITATQDNDLTS